MTLSLIAKELDMELHGEDAMFSRVSTDTRSLAKGDLYLALVGENFDGNQFISQACELGACAAIAQNTDTDSGLEQISKEQATNKVCRFPVLRVADTHKALGKIANINRRRSSAKVIALTGSQGKTTVKEMLGAILSVRSNPLITQANLNNTIGVPLTLLRVDDNHDYVVIEMGANSAGEIAFSAEVTQPDIALITNASAAHIEGFGSLQGIVSAKGEIIDGLSNDGVLVLNADDEHLHDWIQRAGSKNIVRFSFSNDSNDKNNSDYYAADVEVLNTGCVQFKLLTPKGERIILSQLLGKHNVLNAVAAGATAIEAGLDLDDVATGLAHVLPVKGRLCPYKGVNGSILIDDSYNASPASYRAATQVLMSIAGKKIMLAGEMKELGSESDAAHISVGEYAADLGVDELWATGETCRQMIDAFVARSRNGKGKYFDDKAQVIDAAKELAKPGVVFLVKGSRGARMDTVVKSLILDGET
ncbi:MAG: hypothetical protein COA96_07995 [SAR86 cluster bacterium]|uniref:UDP-N-acetylmuramoyl-tripeptide--D-alanyl-D-alanine ligase n=1 Tax=SAR86 cluster bacterium TaxID=2030880 RepID=A0A2A5B1Y0_9GAMM|nr:MAG: hypothetical protein COA96_07995 [SAR86 cluster bacterium]